jgi:hypothetical protein
MNSPGYHIHTLKVGDGLKDAEWGSWTLEFSRVQRVIATFSTISNNGIDNLLSRLRELAPSLKSLLISSPTLPYSQIFGLVVSLPLLEDLVLTHVRVFFIDGNEWDGLPTTVSSPSSTSSPPLTGTFRLSLLKEMLKPLRLSLDLPGGLHFRKIRLALCREEDLHLVAELVVASSGTLEFLDVACNIYGTLGLFGPLEFT